MNLIVLICFIYGGTPNLVSNTNLEEAPRKLFKTIPSQNTVRLVKE